MPKECIVIIDPQKDFTDVNGVYANRHAGIQQIVQAKTKINKLLQTVAPQNVAIVFANYTPHQFAAGLSICIPNTWGHAIDIEMHDQHPRFAKTEHSAFSSAAFVQHLHQQHFTQLVLCGFLAEYCVRATALDALANGYTVKVLQDCIGTADDKQDKQMEWFKELKKNNIHISHSDVFLNEQ